MNQDLTKGNITKTMLIFAFPMMVGNMLQQLYNVVDTLIVGQFLGAGALAAVGIVLYTYDFSYFDFTWALYGKRYGFFDMQR